eukprot:6577636-Prorocentrum_lima.AAC.1
MLPMQTNIHPAHGDHLDDPENWAITMMIGCIICVIKDELYKLEDSDFGLTIYFPPQFEKNHVQDIVES